MNPIKIKIHNFQSIEDLEFEINGFTTITGKTNIGKSAIVRAITSALLNNSVIGMVRSGATHATVEIGVNGHSIKWEKAEKGLNRYTIDGVVYDKVGGKQLQVISDLGFKSVSVGSDEIFPWYASQFFPIFLLDKPGTQVTDFICEVSRLNILQDAVTLSNRGKKRTSDDAKKSESELISINNQLSKLDLVDTVAKLHEDLKDQRKSIAEYERKISYCVDYIERDRILKSEINRIENADLDLPDRLDDDGVSRYSSLSHHHDRLNELAKRVIDIRPINQTKIPDYPIDLERYELFKKYSFVPTTIELISEMERSVKRELPDDISEDIAKYAAAQDLASRITKNAVTDIEVKIPPLPDIKTGIINKAETLLNSITNLVSEYKNQTHSLKQVSQSLEEITDKIKSIPMCPTCSRPVTHDHADV